MPARPRSPERGDESFTAKLPSPKDRPLLLALRTKYRGPAGDAPFFQFRAAPTAKLSATAIDEKGILESAHIAVGIPIVTDGAAALGDGFPQDLLQSAAETFRFCLRKLPGRPAGIDTGPEQGLVRIDIADTGLYGLI